MPLSGGGSRSLVDCGIVRLVSASVWSANACSRSRSSSALVAVVPNPASTACSGAGVMIPGWWIPMWSIHERPWWVAEPDDEASESSPPQPTSAATPVAAPAPSRARRDNRAVLMSVGDDQAERAGDLAELLGQLG